jgi:hypothetical protein
VGRRTCPGPPAFLHRGTQPATCETHRRWGRPAYGPKRSFVAGCVPRWRKAGGPGHVLRPTLAGHRARFAGVAPSTPFLLAQVAATANGACARTPSHLPRHPGGMQRRGTPPTDAAGRWWCPRAQDPFAVASTIAGRNGVDAASQCRLRRCPASVGRRTGAPPPPWRRAVGRLRLRGQTALGRLQPPNLIQLNANSYEAFRFARVIGSAHRRGSSST